MHVCVNVYTRKTIADVIEQETMCKVELNKVLQLCDNLLDIVRDLELAKCLCDLGLIILHVVTDRNKCIYCKKIYVENTV